MVLSLAAAWFNAFRRADVTPIVLVRIDLGLRRVLTVLDATQADADTVTITQGANNYVLTKGVDFVGFGVTLAECASNIANAWNTSENARPRTGKTGIRATSDGYFVHFVGGALSATFGITSSDTTFARETYLSAPGNNFRFVSGDMPLFGYPCCVTDLSTAAASIDAFTRALTIGAVDVEFGDNGQPIRELAKFYSLYLADVAVYIGSPDLAEADFALMGTYVVRDVKPEKGRIVLACEDSAEQEWKNRTVRGAWVGQRPLKVVEDLVTAVGAASAVDLTTLDPALYADISHHVVSRYDDQLFGLQNAISDDRPITEVLEQLLFLSGGALIPRNTGLYAYNHYSHTKASSRTWEAGPPGSAVEGYDVDGVEVIESIGRITNSVKIAFAKRGGDSDAFESFELTDEFSRITYGKRIETTFDLLWCNGYLDMRAFWNASGSPQNAVDAGRLFHDSTHVVFGYAGRQGFSGIAYDRVANAWTLKSGASMGGATGRYCYLLLKPPGRVVNNDVPDDNHNYEQAVEFIAIDQWDLLNQDTDNASAGLTDAPSPSSTRARIATVSVAALTDLGFGDEGVVGRGGLDTRPPGGATPDYNDFWLFNNPAGTAQQIGFTQVVDCTLPIHVAQRILRRFRFGAPEIRVRTTLEHLDLELGDYVAINGDDIYVGQWRDGLTTAVVWEIVGKEVDVLADSPGIVWDLVFVRDDTHTNQVYGFVQPPITVATGAIPTVTVNDRRVYARDGTGVRHVVMTKQFEEVLHL